MATYKAEFLSHYYEGKLRPMTAYTMGLIYWWARIAKPIAPLANFFTQSEPFASLIKGLGGIAQERKMPTFAPQSFTEWFRAPPPLPIRRTNRVAATANHSPTTICPVRVRTPTRPPRTRTTETANSSIFTPKPNLSPPSACSLARYL